MMYVDIELSRQAFLRSDELSTNILYKIDGKTIKFTGICFLSKAINKNRNHDAGGKLVYHIVFLGTGHSYSVDDSSMKELKFEVFNHIAKLSNSQQHLMEIVTPKFEGNPDDCAFKNRDKECQ